MSSFCTAAVLRATMGKCFDYDLRNEEVTASRVLESVNPLRDRRDLADFVYHLTYSERSCLVAQMVKSLPAMRDTWVQYLGPADPLEKEMATSCLGNPMDRGAWQTTVHGVANSQMRMSNFTFTFSL